MNAIGTSKNKKISIVTVTYNSSEKIVKLLRSLEKNKQHINEVIVIENNSPDKKITQIKCRKFTKKLNLTFIHNDNVGFGKSCNLGALKAKSDYILFLNPDTELEASSLKLLVQHADVNRADITGGKAVNYEGKSHGSVVRAPNIFIGLFEFSNLGKIFNFHKAHTLFYYEDINILESKEDKIVDAVSGAYLLITKEAFIKLHGFDEDFFMYLEDVDLGVRAKRMGLKVVYCPHSTILHEGGASSKNKYKIRHQAWFDSRKNYFKKHFGLLSNMLIQPIYEVEEALLKKFKKI